MIFLWETVISEITLGDSWATWLQQANSMQCLITCLNICYLYLDGIESEKNQTDIFVIPIVIQDQQTWSFHHAYKVTYCLIK